MLFRHPDHPGRGVRLAYCLNVHPAETLAEIEAGLRSVTVPLRARLAPGRLFGVGMHHPARVAAELRGSSPDLQRLKALLDGEALDAFTFNAFPYGGFHGERVKEKVFEPTWADPRRLEFTLDVLAVASALEAPGARASHISISTHSGAHRTHSGPFRASFDAFVAAALAFHRAEASGGPRAVLAVEAEPRSTCNDRKDLLMFHDLLAWRTRDQDAAVARHMGECLDTCHAAVEFETSVEPLRRRLSDGLWGTGWRSRFGGDPLATPVGKLQFTSALSLRNPSERPDARKRLLAMDEPRYLHQVTGRRRSRRRGPRDLVRVGDLPELAEALMDPGSEWLDCDEWRCHFHVPVDLEEFEGLGTTRAQADQILEVALASPGDWGTQELHLEIETYTWSVLPGAAARDPAALVEGLEREYRHVLGLLASAGWRPA